jgi:hypothetical protein
MAPSATADAPTLSDASLLDLLAAVQARFEREYVKTVPLDAEEMSDTALAKTWRDYDLFCRGFARVGDKYSDNRKVLAAEMEARGFLAKNDEEREVGTVVRLTRRLFARVIGKGRTTTGWQDAWNALYATLPADSDVRTSMDTIKANQTKTKVTLGFEYLDYDPSAPAG